MRLLVAGKLVVGISSGSVSILSEAAHSGVDLFVAVLAWAAIRYAQRPADRTHPYGHGKVETLTSFGEGILILLVAATIVWNAVAALMRGPSVSHVGWGIAVMAVAAVINFGVSRYLLRVGRAEGSSALEATGIELGTDVITATGVVIGLLIVQVTGRQIVDPIVGIVVSCFIVCRGHACPQWGGAWPDGLPITRRRRARYPHGAGRARRGFHRVSRPAYAATSGARMRSICISSCPATCRSLRRMAFRRISKTRSAMSCRRLMSSFIWNPRRRPLSVRCHRWRMHRRMSSRTSSTCAWHCSGPPPIAPTWRRNSGRQSCRSGHSVQISRIQSDYHRCRSNPPMVHSRPRRGQTGVCAASLHLSPASAPDFAYRAVKSV